MTTVESPTQPISPTEDAPEVLDVVVVGAGLSGIGAAYRLRERMPDLELAVLEGRSSMGGTWDLFRYPGIRSDSDMYTLAFPFEPWRHEKAIADGADILQYIKDTAAKHGIDQLVRYDHKVVSANWSSSDAFWTLTVRTPQGVEEIRSRFVYACSGYYSYTDPYRADIPGLEAFTGQVVHPQFWPENLDVSGKRVVIIGSGATAITLVPALAAQGADVTMLQRTPSFVVAQPGRDPLARLLEGRVAPEKLHTALRWKNVAIQWGSYQLCRKAPGLARKALNANVRAFAGKSSVADFDAPYDPWDQRLCVVPDGDLFKAIKSGRAHVITDTIAEVEPHGIRTNGGTVIDADVIVTATGLQVELLGGAELRIDDEPVDVSDRVVYRGCMLEGIPNAGICVGYINASWGLRSDLSNRFIAKMVDHMRTHGYATVVPTPPGGLERRPLLEMDSGYLQRAAAIMPRRSERTPWTMRQDYLAEAREMRDPDVTVDVQFTKADVAAPRTALAQR